MKQRMNAYDEKVLHEFLDKKGIKTGGPTKKVRVRLAALTRVEYSCVLEVPANYPEFAGELVDHFYADVEGSEYNEDPDFWEKGHCFVEEVKDGKDGQEGGEG